MPSYLLKIITCLLITYDIETLRFFSPSDTTATIIVVRSKMKTNHVYRFERVGLVFDRDLYMRHTPHSDSYVDIDPDNNYHSSRDILLKSTC